MKYIFTLLSAFLGFSAAYSQCCPYIGPIQVVPANPSPGDHVLIIVTITTPNQGSKISSSFEVMGNHIISEFCYYEGLATATKTFLDTVDVGPLPAANYLFDVKAYSSTVADSCNQSDVEFSSKIFLVGGNASTVELPSAPLNLVYPNPSAGTSVNIQTETDYAQVVFVNLQGQTVKRISKTAAGPIAVDDLAQGIYSVQLLDSKGHPLHVQKWVKLL